MNKLVDRFTVNPFPATDIVPVRAGYQKCDPGYDFGPVTRDSYTIQYVLSGYGVVSKGQTTIPVHADECFILRPGEMIRLTADVLNPWTYIWIGFRSALELPELHKEDVLPGKNLENLFLEIANCNKPANRPLEPLLLSYIWELIFCMRQMDAGKRNFYKNSEGYVEKACQLISSSYATINVDQLAAQLKLNRSYLSRIFKEGTGISLQSYLTNTRLQAARSLLLSGYTVSQVSSMVGYADIASFSRAFKAYYKFSPRKYVQLGWQELKENGEI